MNIFLLILGFVIIAATLLDFFHTTLSAMGFGFISSRVDYCLGWIILHSGIRYLYKYSGVLHLLVNVVLWLALLVTGSYLVYLSEDQMVIHNATELPATALEKLYYTCYVVSTTGIGDFIPGTEFSRAFTSVLSFSGFGMLTLSVTYLLSVLSAVNHQKTLANYISSMGPNIEKLHNHLIQNNKFAVESNSDIKMAVITHTTNHFSFPVVQRFLTWENQYSAVVQIASLREILAILKAKLNPDSQEWNKIESLEITIFYFLKQHIHHFEITKYNKDDLQELRSFWKHKYGDEMETDEDIDIMMHRSLQSVGKTWKDVYRIYE